MLCTHYIRNPYGEVGALQDHLQEQVRSIQRALGGFIPGYTLPSSSEFPAINLWVDEDHGIATTELAGVSADGIDISVVGKTLTLTATRQPQELTEDERYHRRERWHGQYTRTIELPFTIDGEKVEARFAKGVLYITLPRTAADKPRKITVKSS
ncbi:MAG: Hsp20/alpha crystallin family protein [Nitrospirae bacterium]|nr:Hsp20/alpha crystallin family protein [Nitrospirota bacterium]MBF0593071.1 Hsp20/alpha crystallin family protein [Nitrospirota bacterium]